jgi:glutamine synthetase
MAGKSRPANLREEEKMNCRTYEDVLKAVRDNGVEFVQFWFTDVLGVLKSFAITPSELEEGLIEGMGFDGSSIEGFARIEECDILQPDKSPYEGDPRYVLKRFLEKLTKSGYTYFVGPELEFFYFSNSCTPVPLDYGGYFDGLPLDMGDALRRETIPALQSMGIQVEYDHHEVAPSQHEIDLRYDEALRMADKTMTYRVIVKEVARRHNSFATFMPKPIYGVNGSGMHVHQSLFEGERNAFYDPKDEYQLSKLARHYIAGLMRHAPEITAITNQWVNSYKRLVPGFEAPAYISWARRNRSTMVRVPMYKPGKEKATRVEFRSPDPACNPYLAFAVMLGAGLEGIENKYELPAPIEGDIFKMSREEKKAAGVLELPDSLYSAILLTEKSELVRKVLGDHIFNKFVENKKIEWDRYRTHVSQFEIEHYLPVL